MEVPGLPCFGLQVLVLLETTVTILLTNTKADYVQLHFSFCQQGNKDQRELELGERMSNEAVDINAEEYINKIKMAAGDFAFGIKKLI